MNKKKFWITNKINPNTAQILIYGYISQYDISSADFLIELTQLAAIYSIIQIRINSGGGSVFEGIAIRAHIRNLIKQGKQIDTYTDGISASMAAPIAMSGSKVYISKYGRMMFHKAKGFAEGDADDIRTQAQLVDDAENDIVSMIAEKTGMTTDDVKAKLFQKGVDKWLTAQECIDMKIADEIFDADEVPAPSNQTDIKDLVNLFDTVLNKAAHLNPSYKMKKELIKKLGLPENATDDQIDAAVEASINAKETAESNVAAANKRTVESLVDQAIADKKLVEGEKAEWIKNFEGNADGLRMALTKLSPAIKPTDVIKNKTQRIENRAEGDVVVDEEEPTGWDQLYNKGLDAVENCRKNTPDVYNKLYTEKFGRSPQSMGFVKK